MRLEWAAPQVDGDTVVYRATMTMEVRQIIAHPDRFKSDIGDTYRGIRIIRDETIPLNEIHVIEGNRRMVIGISI